MPRSILNTLNTPCTFLIELPDSGITLLPASPIPGKTIYDHSRSMLSLAQSPADVVGTQKSYRCGLAFDVGDGNVFLLAIEFSAAKTPLVSDDGELNIGHRLSTNFTKSRVNDSDLGVVCQHVLRDPGTVPDNLPLSESLTKKDPVMPDTTRNNTDRLHVSMMPIVRRRDNMFYIIRLCFMQSMSWTTKPNIQAWPVGLQGVVSRQNQKVSQIRSYPEQNTTSIHRLPVPSPMERNEACTNRQLSLPP